jgi:hypothetical protein
VITQCGHLERGLCRKQGHTTSRENDRTILQVWSILQGNNLFTGFDAESERYRGRAHLAEMIALLGPPPPSLLARASRKDMFFSEQGRHLSRMRNAYMVSVDTDVL